MASLSDVLGVAGAIANPTFTYAPTDIKIILHTYDGTRPYEHEVNGYAAGTFIQIERDTPVIEAGKPTMDGRTQRKIGFSDGMYSISVTLTQTSVSNSFIELMYYTDVQLAYENNYWVNFASQEISIVDQKSGMILGPWVCWVESIPSVSYADELETRQWSLKAFGKDQEVAVRGNTAEFEFTGGLGIAANIAKGSYGKLRNE